MDIKHPAAKTLSGTELMLGGASSWSEGPVFLNKGAVLGVAAAGSLDISTDMQLVSDKDKNSIQIGGAVSTSVPFAFSLPVTVAATGTIAVSGGTLEIAAPSGTVNLAGKMTVAADSGVKVSGPSFTATKGSEISGEGTLTAFGTAKVVSDGDVSIASVVSQTGVILVNTDATISSVKIINAGTFGGAGAFNLTTLDWEFGTLAGPGSATVGTLDCKTSGTKTMNGMAVDVTTSANLEGDAAGRTTVNFVAGSVTIPDTASVHIANPHTFVGLWEMQDAKGGGYVFRAQSKTVETL